jgi:predicted N-acetyltransferase YhbS
MTSSLSPVPATAADQPAIDALLDRCFGLTRRTKSSYRLREGSAAVPGLSFVVRDGAALVAAISFWPVKIGLAGHEALLLGPLAVDPGLQGRGLGLMLMRHGLALAKAQGHGLVVLVGDAPYYAKVGFAPLPHEAILMPGPLNRARFLHLELKPGALAGASGLMLPPWRHDDIIARLRRG